MGLSLSESNRKENTAHFSGRCRKAQLFTQTQAGNQRAIRIGLGTAQIGQQAAALADHFQQAATAVVVFGVGFEVGVRSLMRKVNRATCTSEEPVSPSLRWKSLTICAFVLRSVP